VKVSKLPLAIWILLSGAGACTSVFITGLFKLSNYFARYQPRYRRNSVEGSRTHLAVLKNQSNKATTASYLSQTPTQSLKTLLMMIGAVIPLMTMIGTKTLTKQRTLVLKKMSKTLQPTKSTPNPRAATELVRFTPIIGSLKFWRRQN